MKVIWILAAVCLCGCSSYVYRAYFKDTDSSIRGYPIIEPPNGYTGIWTHYKWNGKKLAEIPYWKGNIIGTSFWYKDDGNPYLIRRYDKNGFAEDYYVEPLPQTPAKIPFWFPGRQKPLGTVVISSESEETEQGAAANP